MTTPPRRRAFFTDPERRVDDELVRAGPAAGFGRVLAKPRLIDVVETLVSADSLDTELVGYALRAHVDFVLLDEHDVPILAIELDDPSHLLEPARSRDEMKDAVARAAGLELVRIDSGALRKPGGSVAASLVEWLLEVWTLSRAFDEAQAAGRIPGEEVFDPALIMGTTGGSAWPYAIDGQARAAMMRAWRAGDLPEPMPDVYRADVPFDPRSRERAIAVLAVGDAGWLVGAASVQGFHASGIPAPGILAEELAVTELGEVVAAYLKGDDVTTSAREMARIRQGISDWRHVSGPST